VRRVTVLGGAALFVAMALLAVLWLRRGDRPEDGHPAASSSIAPNLGTMGPQAAPNPSALRALGDRLLALSTPEEVLAGMKSLTKAAEQGDVEAQIALGRIFLQGLPAVPKDVMRAREWFVRAEASHHPSAAYFLGVMSQNGQGAKADPAAAAHWFEIAAQAGSPDAMFLLANAYRAGAGVPKNDAKAIELYEKAGEMEHPAALQALALAYLYGELGLEPDEAEHRRYMMAAEHAIKDHPGRAPHP
jgi:uncharacterized protein